MVQGYHPPKKVLRHEYEYVSTGGKLDCHLRSFFHRLHSRQHGRIRSTLRNCRVSWLSVARRVFSRWAIPQFVPQSVQALQWRINVSHWGFPLTANIGSFNFLTDWGAVLAESHCQSTPSSPMPNILRSVLASIPALFPPYWHGKRTGGANVQLHGSKFHVHVNVYSAWPFIYPKINIVSL